MDRTVSFSSSAPIIRELLKESEVSFVPHGVSMLPLLRDGRDKVTIKAPSGRLKKYDIAFYQRSDGKCVLHRVVRVLNDGYVMCGDNCIELEYGIGDGNIIGVLSRFERDGKKYSPDMTKFKLLGIFRAKTRLYRRISLGIRRRLRLLSTLLKNIRLI